MNTQHRKNRITILVIFAMSIIPFGIAWYLAKNPEIVSLGTNNGELISPPVTTEPTEFAGYDAFTSEHLKELQGHWILINLLPHDQCTEACKDGLHKTRQLALMMGKDVARIRRAAVFLQNSRQPILTGEWQEDARLLKVLPADKLQAKIKQIFLPSVEDGALLVMDPLGNLMMKYAAGFDPYKVRNDLSKLLRISQIG